MGPLPVNKFLSLKKPKIKVKIKIVFMLSYENRAVGRFQWPLYLRTDCAEPFEQTNSGFEYYSTDMCMHLLCVVLYCVGTVLTPNRPFVRVKGKAIPLQAWTGPEGSRKLRIPDFKIIGT